MKFKAYGSEGVSSPPSPPQSSQGGSGALEMDLVKCTSLYKMQVAVKEEILKHKWIESEKAGKDMGFEWALVDWVCKHKTLWKNSLQKTGVGGE